MSSTENLRHLPQLDGVRGLAILIVVLGHLAVFDFGLGMKKIGPVPPIGVNLFFVLSGYLITGILLKTRGERSYYRSFYARRALRIWPLYAVVLISCYTFLNGWIFQFDSSLVRWPWFAVMMQNLVYSKARILLAPLALTSMWSLAVEEQFYLVWPSLVKAFEARTLRLVLLGVVIFAPIARLLALKFQIDPYANPLCRFDGMAEGGLVALWLYHKNPDMKVVQKVLLSLVLGSVLILAAGHFFKASELLNKSGTNLLFTALLLATLRLRWAAMLFNVGWLKEAGKLSYAAYLLHLIVAFIIAKYLPGHSLGLRIVRIVLILGGTYAVASASFYLFEGPILRLKRYFPASGSATLSARGVTTQVAAALLLTLFVGPRLLAQGPCTPDWASLLRFAGQNQPLLKVSDPNRVVFLGDSITEHWIAYDPAFFKNTSLINRGIYGQITSQMLVRFGPDVLDLKPQAVVILAGTNDLAGNGGPETVAFIEGNLRSMAQLAEANHVRVVLSSILPVSDVYKPQTSRHDPKLIAQINDWMRIYCIQSHCTFLDYTQALSDPSGQLRRDLTEDGLHPNLAGYKVMEPQVLRVLHLPKS